MMFNKIEKELINIQKPGRYIGNEIGIPEKDFINSEVRVVIGYPDIYEIGMSNHGLRILYDIINKLDFASCERVFSPWVDMEELLRKKKLPLFSLETKTPLNKFDIVGISLQYELLFSNFLNILDLSNIEIFADKRKEKDPIVICGGPATVNPAPYSPFTDLFVIGEAEDILNKLLTKYKTNKDRSRSDILKELSKIPGVHSPKYSKQPTKRQIYSSFHKDIGPDTYIVPNIDIVQNKHVVEIMRGCPNKCRFCEAGVIYKPYREKSIETIFENIDKGIKKLGTKEVTLSSLSSGDHSNILDITDCFIKKYSSQHISFSLPSLKVESFDPKILNKISSVRKSGLTFAIETGSKEGQLSINKIVDFDKIKKIIGYAKDNGWRLIKLYFMVGIPYIENELADIITFIDDVLSIDKNLRINLNLAVFVPKPHTPYQFVSQLDLDRSLSMFEQIEYYYKRSRVKIKKHDPYASYLEGFIARGDEKVGLAVYQAFKNGAKFDGWREHFDIEIYNKEFEKNNITSEKYLSKKDYNSRLPWDNIDVGVTKEYLIEELEKSKNKEATPNCKEQCDKYCNICNKTVKKIDSPKTKSKSFCKEKRKSKEYLRSKYVIEFSKLELMKYIGHIDIIKYFEKLFRRSDIEVKYTEGFNPHPKLRFTTALSLGIESECELVEFYTLYKYEEDELLSLLKKYEHKYIPVNKIKFIDPDVKINIFADFDHILYRLDFEKKYSKKIKEILHDYKNQSYEFYRKKKTYKGKYKNIFKISQLNENFLIVKAEKKPGSPKFLYFVKEIFNDLIISTKKINIKCIENKKSKDLFACL